MRKLHPGIKLSAVMLITVVIFFLDKIYVCVSLIIALALFRLMARVPFLKVKHIVNLVLLAAFIVLIQAFFGGGFFFGLAIACRIFSLALLFPILTETTSPYALAAALHSFGFQYRIAFIITAAFNQVPVFSEEARLIMDAQKLRGLSAFEKRRSFFGKLRAYAGICLPLVLGAMRKAQISSVAMDSRAFGVYKTRSWLDKPKLKTKDCLFFSGCLVFAVLLLVFNYADYQF